MLVCLDLNVRDNQIKQISRAPVYEISYPKLFQSLIEIGKLAIGARDANQVLTTIIDTLIERNQRCLLKPYNCDLIAERVNGLLKLRCK